MRNGYHSVDAPRPSAGRRPLVVGIGIGLLTWSLLASGLASAQVISISSCPVVISQPGSYIVTQDLTCPTPAVAITINASSVVLNLGGHRVSGGMSHGIAVGAVSGVTILNGTIAGFGGIVVANSTGNLISSNTATGNAPVDLFDSSATCDANLWASNAFVSANPPSCIH